MAKQTSTLPTQKGATRNVANGTRKNRQSELKGSPNKSSRRIGSANASKRRVRMVLSFLSKLVKTTQRFASAFVKNVLLPCLRQLRKLGQGTAQPQNQGNNRTSQSDTQVHSVVYDARGRERLRLSHRTQDYQEGQDGNMVTQEEFQNLELTNGQIWNFAQMARPGKDAIHVSQCFMCRPGAYTPTSLIRTCYRCGRAVCPQHFSRCSDGHFRCKQCHLTYRVVHDGLKPIFFKKVH